MLGALVLISLLIDVASACDARSLISNHEGKRLCVYKDTMGHPTIGIGYNLDNSGAPAAIAAVGANYDEVRSGKQCLTDSQVMQLFEPSYQSAVSGAQRAVSSFSSLCCTVQEVMIDMDYNLGDGGFASFGGFISLINQKQWAAAASDGQHTAWCRQVGGRCSEDMGRVRQGCGGLTNATSTTSAPAATQTLPLVEESVKLTKPTNPFRITKTFDTCTGPHDHCCGAPGDDPNNCPAAARTSDCDAKKACCCG